MTHCLVSFLGRVPREDGGKYKHARNHFPDGNTEESSFLCFPLRKWLSADRLVVLGTAGSMWDNLFEGYDDDASVEEQRLTLIEKADSNQVTQQHLNELAPWFSTRCGYDVDLRIIPRGAGLEDQTEILNELKQAAPQSGTLSIDVTHSFRHLPIFALTAALYLRVLNPNLNVKLWYGEMQPTDPSEMKTVQVRDLSNLLTTVQWLGALTRQQLLGDYEDVADIVDSEGHKELAGQLRKASHFQNIHLDYKAKDYVRSAKKSIQESGLQGPGALFQKTLLDRMSWVNEGSPYMQQRNNALNALQRKDYMRASLIGYEAFKTLQVQEYFDENSVFNEELRDRAVGRFLDDAMPKDRHKFTLLSNIRNVIAHANRPEHSNPKAQEAIENAIKTQDNLHSALNDCFNTLLPVDQ